MADITDPVFVGGKWRMNKDPNNKHFYRAKVGPDLAVMGTTIASVSMVLGVGMVELSEPTFVGADITVMLTGIGTTPEESFATFRVVCTNGEQFDRTIWFDKVEG